MKKLLILLICALLMSCAMAEGDDQAWRVRICSIEAEKGNRGMGSTQEIESIVGRKNGEYWVQAIVQRSIDLKMHPCLTFQVKLAGNTLIGSIEGANDALLTEDAASFLEKYNISLARAKECLDGIFVMLENRVDPQIENFTVDFYKNGENGGYFEITLEEMEIRFQLLWERFDGEIPFQLNEESKSIHVLDASSLGEGTDLPAAFRAGLEELKKSASFCAMLEFILD